MSRVCDEIITLDGLTGPASFHAKRLGMKWTTVKNRVERHHWTLRDALTIPKGSKLLRRQLKARSLTDLQILAIRTRRAQGEKLAVLEAEYGPTQTQVVKICNGKVYTYPKDIIALAAQEGIRDFDSAIRLWSTGMTEENKAKLVRYVDREIRRMMAQSESEK